MKQATFTLLETMSLRLRLVLITLGLLTVALAVAGTATIMILQNQLVRQIDQDMLSFSPNVHIRGGANKPDRAFDGSSGYDERLYTLRRGQVIALPASRVSVGAPNLEDLSIQPFNPEGGEARIPDNPDVRRSGFTRTPLVAITSETVGSIEGDNRWRVLVREYECPKLREDRCFVTTSFPLVQVERTLKNMGTIVILSGVLVLAACAALGLLALRGAFAPLREVEAVTGAFAAGDTSRRVSKRPSHTEVGQLGHSINMMLDRIETTLEQREASEAKMRQFVADASHELRTPLVSVRGFAELYRQGAVQGEENVGRAFGRIEDEAKRMGGLVEDMLVLARLDEQRPMQLEDVSVTRIARDIVADGTTLDPDRTFTLLDSTDDGGEDIVITGDDGKIRQVVTNLVVNAVRHTTAGTPIEVAVTRDGDSAVLLQVIDHGQGIPPEQAEKIFERFFRADGSRQRGAGGGSGLGLAIVASIVTALRGTVSVQETPGGGATFVVRLPVAQPQTPEAA